MNSSHMVAEKSFWYHTIKPAASWGVTSTQLHVLWIAVESLLDTENRLACIVLAERSRHPLAKSLCSVSSLSTTVYTTVRPIHILNTPAAYPKCHYQKHNCYLSYNRSACFGCPSWLFIILYFLDQTPQLLSILLLVLSGYNSRVAFIFLESPETSMTAG